MWRSCLVVGVVSPMTDPTVIIIAAGEQTRWGGHLGVNKHEIMIDGERLLDRTVRLALENGAGRVCVVAKPGMDHYASPGAELVYADLDPSMGGADKFLSSRHLWSQTGRTIVLYGDVYFTDAAMRKIFTNHVRRWQLFCRFGPSTITGATAGECFAQSFYPEHLAEHEANLRRTAKLWREGVIKRCGGWEHARAMAGAPDNRLRKHRPYSIYVEINDFTEDFDYPRDYDVWVARRTRTVSVLVPWRPDGGPRDAAWEWVRRRWEQTYPQWQLVTGTGPAGMWCKAAAVADALTRATGSFLVVADADLWCDGVSQAVQAVFDGAPWAMPHGKVCRLDRHATAQVLAGGPLGGGLTQPPYRGVPGGGMVVVPRDVYKIAPLDSRFVGWGQEDTSWAVALDTLAGNGWRGTHPLFHLWHPPQPRMNRHVGNAAGWALHNRYLMARGNRVEMRALLSPVVSGQV